MLAVAVSGGVDSLFALYERVQALGPDQVLAVYGRMLPVAPERDPVPGLEANCRKLGVRLHVSNAQGAFKKAVMAPFAAAYAAGETPNPCALCNPRVKFGLLLDEAQALGADQLATGHYARLMEHPVYGVCLGPAADVSKDQSYFLALVPRERLARLCFPLSLRHKADIRTELAAAGLDVPLPVESQEICFIPDNDYRGFLGQWGLTLSGPGPVVLMGTDRVLGQHQGLWRHTEGQRRGLGIAWQEPLYVVGKNTLSNTLLVGPQQALSAQTCATSGVNLLVPPELWPDRLFARIRYRQKQAPADVRVAEDGLRIAFHEAQNRAAPGQLAVICDAEGVVLAGGIISNH